MRWPCVWLFCSLGPLVLLSAATTPPNIVLIFADDLGFGDLGSYGHPTSATPNLDKMAARGLRFTDFYASCPVCSPSRAALLTGRYQTRSGVYPGVFYPGSRGGLPLAEVTVAEVLKAQGYATAMVGKWHLGLGANSSFLPIHQGFDHFLGVPYSHDQGPGSRDPRVLRLLGCPQLPHPSPLPTAPPIPLPCPQLPVLPGQYCGGASPLPLLRPSPSEGFRAETSPSLQTPSGRLHPVAFPVDAPAHCGVTADGCSPLPRSPETMRMARGGSSGLLKAEEPALGARPCLCPCAVCRRGAGEPGVTHELASTLDILPTLVTLDGYDLSPVLFGRGKSPRQLMFYYPPSPSKLLGVFAVRYGKYKAHFFTQGSLHSETTPDPDCHGLRPPTPHTPPVLIDLEADPAENYDLLRGEAVGPEVLQVLKEIQLQKALFDQRMEFGESQIGKGSDPALQPCCIPRCTPKPSCCQCP
uniref:Arylsulfatase A n=1 Tax=Pelodiscus sinensis TaxID=13735 RepID=K7FQ78_PELSI